MQWEKLTTEVATRKDVNQDWWKEKIDAAHKTRAYTTSAKVFFRVLRSYVLEDVSPYCTHLFKHTVERGNAIPSCYSLTEAAKVNQGFVSKKVSVWLSVEDIIRVNTAYVRFANRLCIQIGPLGLIEKDYLLIPTFQYDRINGQSVPNDWIAPPIKDNGHFHTYMRIIREEAPRFCIHTNQILNMLDIPSDLELNPTQITKLHPRFEQLFQSTQVSITDFRKWQKCQTRQPVAELDAGWHNVGVLERHRMVEAMPAVQEEAEED